MNAPAARTRNRGVLLIVGRVPIGVTPSGPFRRSNHRRILGPLVPYTSRDSSAFQIASRDRPSAWTATRPPVMKKEAVQGKTKSKSKKVQEVELSSSEDSSSSSSSSEDSSSSSDEDSDQELLELLRSVERKGEKTKEEGRAEAKAKKEKEEKKKAKKAKKAKKSKKD